MCVRPPEPHSSDVELTNTQPRKGENGSVYFATWLNRSSAKKENIVKTKLFPYLGLALLGLALSATPAAAQLQWSPAQSYDTGQDTAVAMHPSGLVLEFHRTHVYGGLTLWYRVGRVEGNTVTWGRSQGLPGSGTWPNVAITREGYVLYVWSTYGYKTNSDLKYMVGKIDPNGDANQSITWLTYEQKFDSGFHSSTVVSDNGVIVEVHESGRGGKGLYYRVGHLADPATGNFNIVWDSGDYGQHYDDGINPDIALNNRNEVVEVHQVTGEALLHDHRGVVLSGGVIDFRPSQRYDNDGGRPAVALTDSGLVAALSGSGTIYARTGTLSLSNLNVIDWLSFNKISDTGTYPAVATNGSFAVGTWTEYFGLEGELYYSVAKIP